MRIIIKTIKKIKEPRVQIFPYLHFLLSIYSSFFHLPLVIHTNKNFKMNINYKFK